MTLTPEQIEEIAIRYHNLDGDDHTIRWGMQKSNYRGCVRKTMRQVVEAIEGCGFEIAVKSKTEGGAA